MLSSLYIVKLSGIFACELSELSEEPAICVQEQKKHAAAITLNIFFMKTVNQTTCRREAARFQLRAARKLGAQTRGSRVVTRSCCGKTTKFKV